ncbi:MAG: hypothetical protein DCF19_16205 [Pseudanabaena frigida]|uniref:DUF1830 domain-containing protein n=1 Tax=Pseudanabaena frigida TaxID=945775 RepID=A0A2W4W1N5_9CYAN|nr:MAG: hypothetical protein DCF19_16205 [Pseudanabaena frigida]
MLNTYFHISNKISYHYANQTGKIQIVRLQIGINECIERAVFPENYFDFDAPPNSWLEIHSYETATAVLCDRIPCQQLIIDA